MIRLKNITMKDFFSHKDTFLDFEEKNGLVLIEGINEDGKYDSNGSGKSTILEGIVYALSGSTLRNVGVNDVVNRRAGKDTEVSLEFSVNSKLYKVSRYRKHSEFNDSVVFLEDGKDISKRVNKDTQKLIDDTIDIPYKILTNTILLGEGLSSRFTQLSDPEKKSLIESTLNLSYDLDKSRDIANQNMKDLKLKLSNIDGRILTLETILQEDLDSIQRDISEAESQIPILQSKIKGEETLLEAQIAASASIGDKKILVSNTILEVENLEKSIQALEKDAIALSQELEALENSPLSSCSLCGQPLRGDSKKAVKENLSLRLSTVTESMKESQGLINNYPSLDILKARLVSLSEESLSYSNEIQRLQGSINSNKLLLSQLESKIASNKSTIEKYDSYQEDYMEMLEERTKLTAEYEDYEYLYKLYSPTGLTTILLEEAISYINERIKVYTSILLDKDYHLTFNKGKINLLDSKGSTYQSLSNGEKRRLDISIQFSLHDYVNTYCGLTIDTICVDEILDTLDNTGVNNIIELLNMKKEYCNLSRILVITHNNELKSYFDEIVTVRKILTGDSIIIRR